jgi:hypothetical protein
MEQFQKEIMVGAAQRQFYFKKLTYVEGVKFFITSVDEKNRPISFSMKKNKHGLWSLTPGSLRWLYDINGQLADAITESQSQKPIH